MRKVLVWGFEPRQGEALKKIFASENFQVDVVAPSHNPTFRGYSVIVCNLDLEPLRSPEVYSSVNQEDQLLIGICSSKVLKSLPHALTSRFFDVLKKPLSSNEIKNKAREVSQVVRLKELARVNAILFESFDALIDLYSYDDPYRVMERLLDILLEELEAKGAAGWIKGVEVPGKYILASARGEIEMKEEPSTLEFRDLAIDEDFPRNELLEMDAKPGANIVLLGVLDFQGDPVAVIKVFIDYHNYDPLKVRGMQAILRIGAAALHSTSKLEKLRRTQLIDTQMRVYNLSFFRDYLDKEIQKAQRFGRVVSVLFISIENYSELKKRYRPMVVQEAINKMLMRVNSVVRSADVVSKLREDRYAVVLSETDYYGALTLKKRLMRTFWSSTGPRHREKEELPLRIIIVEASYPRDGLDYGSLLDVGEKKIEHTRHSLYSRLNLEDKTFLDSLDEIYGYVNLKQEEDSTLSLEGDADFLRSLKVALINEIVRNPSARGVLYVGEETISKEDPFFKMHHHLKNTSTKVYLLTGQAHTEIDLSPIVPVFLGTETLKGVYFLLYTGELGMYCIFLKRRKDGTLTGFHSTDIHLVENLAVKIEDSYVFEREL